MTNKKNRSLNPSELDDNTRLPWIKTILTAGLLFILIPIGFYTFKFGIGLWGKPEEWGQLGDFFGGVLNPILGFLSFLLLLVTLTQNQKALRQNKIALDQNKDALEINSEELQLTREEVSGSREALEQQAKILEKQNFEGTFFQLLSLYNEIVTSINMEGNTGRDYFITLRNRLRSPLVTCIQDDYDKAVTLESINQGYLAFYASNQHKIGHYFRILFNIIKFVDNSSVGNKKTYTNLLRAQMSSSELVLLFYNCLSNEGIAFKPLIEKYSLLKFLPQDNNYLYFDGQEIPLYEDSAYNKINSAEIN